jgi:hypothetical protein
MAAYPPTVPYPDQGQYPPPGQYQPPGKCGETLMLNILIFNGFA